ncbi:hypothetical protein RCC89_16195 [Cytophagaceae bacterium ABcell3]|nr:hypothetical protein RCC89_16195 [Cytophagaceae bacterium ABcell3]
MDQTDNAIQYFKKALRLDSSFTATYLNYSFLLNKEGRYNEAIALLEKGYRFTSTQADRAYFNYNLALAHRYLENCPTALNKINEAIRLIDDQNIKERFLKTKKRIDFWCGDEPIRVLELDD